jgi:CxxC motif-containing protein (DUF1111 family)
MPLYALCESWERGRIQESFMSVFHAFPLTLFISVSLQAQFIARDPGLRKGSPGAGQPLSGLLGFEKLFLEAGAKQFTEVESVQGKATGASGVGLGPRFNLDSCAGCHAHPAVGGSSPALNPQISVAGRNGATNALPSFLSADGPIREARLKFRQDGTRDGGVYSIFTIAGRADAPGCSIDQPDFEAAARADNLAFRIPTPVFGAGLIESIPDAQILANQNSNIQLKQALGIAGRVNRSPGGAIGRFGWKSQHNSLLLFTAEAYVIEQGVTNEIFPSERDGTETCQFNATPEDHTKSDGLNIGSIFSAAVQPTETASDMVKLASYIRLLAAPTPAPPTRSSINGAALFDSVGCTLCHTPMLRTGKSSSAALSNKPANLYSDLLVHNMGPRLADDIVQGDAGPAEFRTAPLWGIGQRIYFQHDGRTSNLLDAIRIHASEADSRFPASEANAVITQFEALPEESKQDILNFLRSL